EGKASVVFDAPQNEVRALVIGPDGALYAGTAAEAASGTTAAGSGPTRPNPGDNAVYRIGPEGAAREVFRAPKSMIYALAWRGDHLLVGVGPEGLIHEVKPDDREAAQIARLDHGGVLALLAEPDGGVLVGAGDPGAVLRLAPGFVASGTITSDVFDAKLAS